MEERSSEGKRSPLDDIINHMTADWHSYGLPPAGSGPPQAPGPHNAHLWTNWPSSPQVAGPNSGQVPGPGVSVPGRPAQPQPFFVIGGEPGVPVFFQADQPPPGYPMDPPAGKAQDFFSQPIQVPVQAEGHDLGGTMVDVGGGNFVKVRYSGGHGGTVNPQYLPVGANPSLNSVLPPPLENLLPHPNAGDPKLQQGAHSNNYGLFREHPPQQAQTMMRLHTSESESPQHQSRPGMMQHGPPGLLQPSQTLFNEHLQNQQFQQHIFSVTQPQFQHDLLQRVQRQHYEQQQQHQQGRHQDSDQPQQIKGPFLQDEAAGQETKGLSSSTQSQNQDQLIQNLVGNWTVPNQTGRYNPFGLAMSDRSEPVQETIKDAEQAKKNDKSVRRARIVAEVRPMRPSYSAVLTTPSPVPSPQKPTSPTNSSNAATVQNNNHNSAVITNATNKMNVDASRQKSSTNSSGGKGKNSALKVNGVVNAGGKLKRQHSIGNEDVTSGNRVNSNSATKSSGLSSSSSGDLDESALGNSSPSTLSRRWVSLDDLESDVSGGDASNAFGDGDNSLQPAVKDGHFNDKKTSDKSARSSVRGNVKHSSGTASDEGFLNNHKAPPGVGPQKGNANIGSNSTKRPIHINNNLGTNHGSHWASQQQTTNNSSKGDKSSKPIRSIRTGSDERKGPKADGKIASGGSGSSGPSGRAGRGSMGSMADKAAVLQGRRNQRGSRRKDGVTAVSLAMRKYGQLGLAAIEWFFHLLSDVVGMSLRLSLHLCLVFWENWIVTTANWIRKSVMHTHLIPDRVLHSWAWRCLCKWLGKGDPGDQSRNGSKKSGRGAEGRESVIPGGLSHNISMPATGEEAMKRLLACKGKDPYSILGVTPTCSDDDVKKYYKRQAFLVHPDKNNQPGAEEAFKILVHAFELIGEPEKRDEYDRRVAETHQVEQAWSELSDLLSQLHQKMEYAANTIRCTNCGKRHKRIAVPRKPFAARFCAQCKIKHSAKEGDIWAETMVMGFLWHYYACMEGAVYDITDWASCQTNNLRHLKPNSHTVQYRIVLGRQRQQSPRTPSEPDLENFLSSLYNQTGGTSKGSAATGESSACSNVPNRQDTARNRKKGKRNK